MPPIEGLEQVPTWTSDEALSSDELPRRLIVLGGGPVGCELASIYRAYGVQVTLVEAADQLVAREDPAIGAALAEVLRADGVELRLGAAAGRVRPVEGGLLLTLDGAGDVSADRMLVATGRAPVLEGLGLQVLGLKTDEPGLRVDARCRVLGADHVFAAGDVTGTAPYTHTANYHARLIIDELSGHGRDADQRAIPRAVYTDPPLAAVGLTAAEAREAGLHVLTETVDLAETARALAEGDGKLGPAGRHGGVLVLHADRDSGELIGAAAVGAAADSWIGEAQLAIRARVPVRVLADLVHPFPAWSEAYGPAYRALAARLTGR
jgi:dihydrolipoamide dehydrogenase